MRFLISIVALLVVGIFALTTPTRAAGFGQGVSDRPGQKLTDQQKQELQERKQRREETERNYNATIKSVPDSKEKYDPWKGSR